jgi:TRAP-type uncharacterized transport system fused permease subunit
MKRAGYGGIKAGAIETSSSVNGQIMPPVMGSARRSWPGGWARRAR